MSPPTSEPRDRLEAAMAAHQAGRLDEAAERYRLILAGDANNADAHHLLGLVHEAQGRVTEAEAALRHAVGLREDPLFLGNLARLLRKHNRAEEAEALLRRALVLQPSAGLHLTLANLLKAGGRTAEAEAAYRSALALQPGHRDALTNLGNLLQAARRHEEAEACYRRATRADPGHAPSFSNLGVALKALRRWEDAEAAYRQALALDPRYVEATVNLANLLKDRGRPDEAQACLERALALDPRSAQALNSLGVIHQGRKDWAQAEDCYRQALAVDPGYAEAANNLGTVLEAQRRKDEAEQAYEAAVAIRPDFSDALNNLGNVLVRARREAEAEAAYRRALAADPDHTGVIHNSGILLAGQGRTAEAEAAYRRALALKPDFADAHNNLGALLQHHGRFAEAEACYRRALELDPGKAETRLNLGTLLLSLGRWSEGWSHYEGRYDIETENVLERPRLAQPMWGGEPLAGRSVLLWPEQGFGDSIQFVRYAPVLKAHGAARVWIAAREPLRDLLATADGIDGVAVAGEPLPPCDCWTFLLSVPLHLGTTPDTVPAQLPYLRADGGRVARWQPALPQGRRRVGLVWKGSPGHKNDANRSLPGLASLAPLWEVPGVDFVSLQKGQGEEEALAPPPGQPLTALGDRLQDFADAAAVVSQLDLVICVDTATAHLAGALGKPVWVLVPGLGTDWRWLQDRTDSPWYPGVMRLFREDAGAGWPPLIAEVAAALRAWAAPPDADAWLQQAVQAHQQGDNDAARRGYQRVLEARPGEPDALHLLGVLTAQEGDAAAAQALVRRALQADERPPFLETLARLLKDGGQLDEAEAVLRRALALAPRAASAWFALANLLKARGPAQEAEAAYRQAIALDPSHADSCLNLGNLLHALGRDAEALALYRQATRAQPRHAPAHYNLGSLLLMQPAAATSEAEAEQALKQAIVLQPDYPQARLKLGMLLLSQGRLAEGWPLYEARHNPARGGAGTPPPLLSLPRWQGGPLAGRRLLVVSEQGHGDALQFVRYAAELKARGAAHVTWACYGPLAPLLQTAPGVDAVAPAPVANGPQGYDCWCYALSLPLALGSTLDNLPARLPYLQAPADRRGRWSDALPAAPLRVGLVWRGAPEHKNDAHRSLPGLAALAPLWQVPGVAFVSLQKGQAEDEALAAGKDQPITALGHRFQDFADAASAVEELDLVICVDTATAHLAGALGKPVWVLLPALMTDWRWLKDRTDSPWYPGVMRLFRQRQPGEWEPVIRDVAAALRDWSQADQVHDQAIALARGGELERAEALFRRALAVREHPLYLGNFARLLHERGRAEEGWRSMERALALAPDSPLLQFAAGNLLRSTGRLDEAESAFRRAVALAPGHRDAWNNLGAVLQDKRQFDASHAALVRATEIDPGYAQAHYNLALLFHDHLGTRDDGSRAEACYRQALALDPGDARARLNLGVLLLTLGRFDEGWRLYEARHDPAWRDQVVAQPAAPFPAWQGEPLQGRSLLLWTEQGFGDALQFIRYAALLKSRGLKRLTVVADPALHALLATAPGVDQVVGLGASLPLHDFWCYALSLPLRLGTTLDSIPAALPYLSAPAARVARWRERLGGPGRKVGLVWRGAPGHRNDTRRSLPGLAALAALWAVPGLSFVSLQKGGPGEQEALAPPTGQPLLALGHEFADFADAAAVISQLDLVVCVDTATAHLAGALGKPVWVLLPAVATDWRWLRDRADSPWYPGVMRLFRQRDEADWAPLVEEVAQALRSWSGEADPPPERAREQNNLGNALAAQGRTAEAEAAYRQALAERPGYAKAWNNLGNLLQQQGRIAEADAAFREAIRLEPGYASPWSNLGNLLLAQRRLDEARDAYGRAAELAPGNAVIQSNLGALLWRRGELDQARQVLERALSLDEGYAEGHNTLGLVLKELRHYEQAEACYRRALALDPQNAKAGTNLAMLLLAAGRWAEGWPHYESRHALGGQALVRRAARSAAQAWQGQPLQGRSLVLWTEQGLGDTLQFVRYAPLLKARGAARLSLVCPAPLVPLLAAMPGLDEVTEQPMAPSHDFWACLLGLPLLLGTTLDHLPAALPYLTAAPERVARWAPRLPQGRRVGLVWRGMPGHVNDVNRSLPGLASLAPLWRVPGLHFVSLQKGSGEDEALEPPAGQAMTSLGRDLQDFADTAAVVAQLDLVICVDTAVAHLAGALGKPVWLLLPALGTDWRWLRDRADSPWYPGLMRLFRQRKPGRWDATVAEVAQALAEWAASPGDTAALHARAFAAHSAGRLDEAEHGYLGVLAREPQHADAAHMMGLVKAARHDLPGAEQWLRRALERSDHPQLRVNLGTVLKDRGDLPRAEAEYRAAAERAPGYPQARFALGALLQDSGRLEEAQAEYEAALALAPDHYSALNNLGNVLRARGLRREALACCERLTALHPTRAEGFHNLGLLLQEQLERPAAAAQAEAAYRRALELRPGYPQVRLNLAQLLLAQGRFAEGWPLYESRHDPGQDSRLPVPTPNFPQWRGEPLEGRSLALWAEQGHGDLVQFVRYAELLRARGLRRLTVVCPPALALLIATAPGLDEVVTRAPQEGHDYWAFALGLPLQLGTTLETVPARLPYLRADPQRMQRWATRLPQGPRVGLAWKGGPAHPNDAYRSLPSLEVLAPLWRVPGLQFVSLQKGSGEAEALAPPAGQPLAPLGQDFKDFADSAAVIAQLDLVICVDTALAHVAGALGKPVWVLLPAFRTDWRWLLDRDDSPWYPGVMRLFRQKTPGDWVPVVEQVAQALRDWARR